MRPSFSCHVIALAGPALDPAQRLGMAGVALLAVHQDRVQAVQLAVLAEQALAIQVAGRDVPDAQGGRALAGVTNDRAAPR